MRGVASVAAIAALSAFMAVSCDKAAEAPKPQAPKPAVVVAPVVKSKVTPEDEFIGQTKAQDTVDLVARVKGFLTKKNFTEGQMVKAGELLLQIEKDQYEADVEEAQGKLSAEQAKLNDALTTFTRQDTLWKQSAVAKKDYDNALYAKIGAEATVSQCDAALKVAKLNLSYTDIYAPFDGCVGLCTYSEGNVVGPESQKLATIVKINPMRVEFNIDELDVLRYNIKIASLKTDVLFPKADDLVIKVKLQNGELYRHEGKMSYADNHINVSTGTLLVQAQFPNPNNILIPGMYVKVLISRKVAEESLLIPSKAVLENQSGSYVYAVDAAGKADTKQIKTGARYGQLIAVESGLSEGERVVTDGIQKIRPGIIVQAVEDKVDATPAEAAK